MSRSVFPRRAPGAVIPTRAPDLVLRIASAESMPVDRRQRCEGWLRTVTG